MGAEPWSCFTPYRVDVAEALKECQFREFAAGRYDKPRGFEGVHATIDEALRDGEADGTRSVLDMIGVADAPRNPDHPLGSDEFQMGDFDGDPMLGLVAPLAPAQLIELYGTERPSRAMIEQNDGYYDLLDRGLGIYIVAYEGDEPSEIFFAGYSFD
jgi:hypothetical protein